MNPDIKRRVELFKLDDNFIAVENFYSPGSWKVMGNNTSHTYRDDMNQEKAIAYAAELNKNKQASKTYEEA